MPVASGFCPSCGAPIEFSVGSSVCKVCEYCKATVHRTDRTFEDLGKVADIANIPSLIAIGDEGTLGGRPITVLGRVQLDHGAGPWDEYYVAYDHGASWGWLAYAEGVWYATTLAPGDIQVPPFRALSLELDVPLGAAGTFRIAEVKTGSIVSAEGELPGRFPPGFLRSYADAFATGRGFATLDYGDQTGAPEVFLGQRFDESDLKITQLGPRTVQKVKLAKFTCPNCGGGVPLRSGDRAERVACPYCTAVTDIAARRVVQTQEAAREDSPIPIGATGTLNGVRYTCIAFLVRSASFDGERFAWSELLLFAEGTGFRWLVRDEDGWLFVEPLNLAELDLRDMPGAVRFEGKRYPRRNDSNARVDYVLGEVYWKCEVWETVRASDYLLGRTVISREATATEVRYSRSRPIPYPVIAQAFGLARREAPRAGPEEPSLPRAIDGDDDEGPSLFGGANVLVLLFVLAFIGIVLMNVVKNASSIGGSSGGGPVFGGSGYYYGGK